MEQKYQSSKESRRTQDVLDHFWGKASVIGGTRVFIDMQSPNDSHFDLFVPYHLSPHLVQPGLILSYKLDYSGVIDIETKPTLKGLPGIVVNDFLETSSPQGAVYTNQYDSNGNDLGRIFEVGFVGDKIGLDIKICRDLGLAKRYQDQLDKLVKGSDAREAIDLAFRMYRSN